VLHVTKYNCQGYCTHIENIEKETGKETRAVPDVINNITVQPNPDIDSDGNGECDKR
jgi:hypothetical protein